MIGLKKCPCCGKSADMREHHYFPAVYVVCMSCLLSTRNIYYGDYHDYPHFPTKEEAEKVAAALWNRRRKKSD